MKLTTKQELILSYLRRCTGPARPTEIGQACGYPYHAASAWASGGLKPLVAAGLVTRGDGAFYQATALQENTK